MKRENRFLLQAICFLGVLMEEIYFFHAYQDQSIVIVGGLVVLLVIFYFLFNSLLSLKEQWNEEKSKAQEEMIKRVVAELTEKKADDSRLEMVEKLEKAIYVSLNNSASMLQEELQQLDQHVAADFEALNTQLKETGERNAKIGVKYGRENTKSLMVFQKKAFDNIVAGMEEMVNEVSAMTDKVNANLGQMEQTIKTNTISTFVSGTVVPDNPEKTTVETEISTIEDAVLASEAESMPKEELEAVVSEPASMVEEETSEPDPIVAEERNKPTSGVDADPNHMMTPEEIAALVSGTGNASTEELVAEVSEPEPMPELSSDPNHVMTPEEIAALVSEAGKASTEEPVAEVSEPEPMPELSSDPNHVMTPEEIAVLVSGTGTGTTEEAVSEPEPEPMPELSNDPNHVMTPEEIAALIAGTN